MAKMRTTEYILYKLPIQYETLNIVQYLYSKGYDARPACCIELNHPEWTARDLPSIETKTGKRYVGLRECTEFYAIDTGENPDELILNATTFKIANPEYRVGAKIASVEIVEQIDEPEESFELIFGLKSDDEELAIIFTKTNLSKFIGTHIINDKDFKHYFTNFEEIKNEYMYYAIIKKWKKIDIHDLKDFADVIDIKITKETIIDIKPNYFWTAIQYFFAINAIINQFYSTFRFPNLRI
jgi:hypothetical protein